MTFKPAAHTVRLEVLRRNEIQIIMGQNHGSLPAMIGEDSSVPFLVSITLNVEWNVERYIKKLHVTWRLLVLRYRFFSNIVFLFYWEKAKKYVPVRLFPKKPYTKNEKNLIKLSRWISIAMFVLDIFSIFHIIWKLLSSISYAAKLMSRKLNWKTFYLSPTFSTPHDKSLVLLHCWYFFRNKNEMLFN